MPFDWKYVFEGERNILEKWFEDYSVKEGHMIPVCSILEVFC